MAKSSKEDKY